MVLGLIEALDADSEGLPRLLDEALQGSLWARQIGRKSEATQRAHKAILEARAKLIWRNTTAPVRRGHFAMGVGLESGLALDDMADELATFLDAADDAALGGDEAGLAGALIELGRRLLTLRPFVPDKRNALPTNWEELLKAWVTGVDVNTIGPENLRIVEDAFAYRLVWALEALRTRRITLGWSPETVAGGGAASLETGVPQVMMSMLIRAGLPSRRAAMIAVRTGNAFFIDGTEMRAWLESNEITALTDAGDWPTPETAALWARFRNDTLGGGVQRWHTQLSKRVLDLSDGNTRPSDGVYRVEIDDPDGDAWIATPDYRRLVRLRTRVSDPKPSLFAAHFIAEDARAQIMRLGRGRAIWLQNGA
jgi:hypothetical protein